MADMTTYQPKGGMCTSCVHRDRDCSGLPFASMPVIERDGDVRIVRCTYHMRQDAGQDEDEFLPEVDRLTPSAPDGGLGSAR